MLDLHILTVREFPPDDYVDWDVFRRAREIMEEAGVVPIHCLTIDDVRTAYDRRLTEEQCMEVLYKIQRKDCSWEWQETALHYASDMYPKDTLPGKDPDEEDDA